LRTPRSEFDKLREAFASHISSVFETPPVTDHHQFGAYHTGANIRLFSDGLSEAMGHTYAARISGTTELGSNHVFSALAQAEEFQNTGLP